MDDDKKEFINFKEPRVITLVVWQNGEWHEIVFTGNLDNGEIEALIEGGRKDLLLKSDSNFFKRPAN